MTYVLAADLGTGGPKVALVSTSGDVAGYEIETNGLLLTDDGGVEQDPDEWWTSIVTAARRLLARELVPRDEIAAVSVTAQWMGTIPVDERGAHLRNALIWMDSRGSAEAARVAGGGLVIPTTGYNANKARKWLTVTGGLPSRTGKDPVGHILWLKRHEPEIYRAAHKLLDVPDYLNARLCGRICSSYDGIVGHWCTDNRDLTRVTYVEELIRLNEFDRAKLPDLVPTCSIIGTLRPEVAAELGLSTDVKVVTGTGDTSSAGIGAGAVRDYEAHLYIGTSSWLSCHVPFKKVDLAHNITSLPSGIPERYWVATEQDVAGKALTWLVDSVLHPEDDLRLVDPPDDVFDRLNAVAAGVAAGSDAVLFAPWLNGERTPVDNHLLRATWFNLGLGTTRAHMVRAVFEGVALNTRWMLSAAERFVRKQRPGGFEHVNFVGGGAQSELWCQILADVLNRPIRRIDQPRLANARGAAFAAAVALGELRWEDIPTRISVTDTFTPDPTNRAVYDRAYDAFLGLYKHTKGIFAMLNRDGAH